MTLGKRVMWALSALVLSSTANADPITWAVNGVSFEDGGTLTGSFSTDQSTGSMLSFDLTSSGGTVLQSFHYTNSNSVGVASPYFSTTYMVVAIDSSRYISLGFDQWLTAAGTFAVKIGPPSYECLNCNPYRWVAAGSVTAVPEPATYALLVSGLGVAGLWVQRRRTAQPHCVASLA